MIRRCVVNVHNVLNLCLAFGVYICQLQLVDSISIPNIGIKLCQSKCIQYGCRGIRYNVETLTCHLSERTTDVILEEAEHFFDPTRLSDVEAGICTFNTCLMMRCLETHAAKTVCVKDGHYQTHNQTFVSTTLIDVCSLGDLYQVKNRLSQDTANINIRGENGRTPAMIAAEKGHREILELLVKKGANLSLLDDRDNNILHVASLGGSLETVKYIHSQNIIDIDSRGENGTTPLRIAALFGKMEVFSFLIKIGAEISKEDHNGGNILHVACQGGNVDIVKCVLRHKALYINSTDYKGITPLMSAAGYGNKVVFHVLIDRGADALAKDATNRNILHWTCQGGNVKILNFILTRNIVDINSRNRDKMTPLLLAAYYKKRDVIDLLIERGAHTLAVDHKSRNILYLSCSSVDLETVNYILKQNIVDINTKGEDGKTQVLVAAYLGNGEVFDILVKKGANLSVVTNNRDNILHLAIRGGNIKIVKYILTQDVVVIDSKGFEDMTPVLLAADVGNIEVFDILVNKGADLSVVDKDGESILHLAIRERNVKMVNYILTQDMADIDSKGSKDMTPVLLEAYMGNIEVFDILVNKGANLSVVNEDGDNVLHLAIRGENVKMVNYILTQDIVDINSKGFEDMTPVLLALDVGSTEIFDILVNKGADLSVVNEDEESILHLAIEEGNVEIVNSILAQNIVDINSTDCDGTTPVLLTALMGNIEVFDILVNKGADLSVVDDDGNNVLHLACLEGNEDIVKRVLSMGILDVNTKNDKGLNATMIAREKGYLSIAKSLSQVS